MKVLKFPSSAPTSATGKKKRVDTIVLDAETLRKLKNPRFQRPFKMNQSVKEVVEEIRTSGVFPGILTLGLLLGDVWIIDGQHRIEAVRITERTDVLADVHYLDCDSEEEMASEFRKLNSSLVRFGPDDLLRAREISSPSLQLLRQKCKFVGYDQIRRSDSSPIISVSQILRAWFGSEPETPHASPGSATMLADRLTAETASDLIRFLTMAFDSWGRDVRYQRLWTQLNLTLTMWIYRRVVLTAAHKAPQQRRVHLTNDLFGKCLLSLSADSLYLDYLLGRKMNDDHRSPTYDRIRRVFVRRLREEGMLKANFPQAPWVSR